MEYGYIRVSSREQNVDRQLLCLRDCIADENKIYIDKQSGKDFNRLAYRQLLRRLKQGDLVIIKSIDRLGRDYDEILEQWRIITKMKKADIFVIDFPLLDTRNKESDLTGTFIADLVLQILSYVAQTEREFIHQRQAEGIAAAKQRGVQFGRSKLTLPPTFAEYAKSFNNGTLSLTQAAIACGMSRTSFYRYAKK